MTTDAPIAEELDPDVRTARDLLRAATTVAVLTGAGISTDSGIPDFRGPQGLWTKEPGAEKLATIQHYVADADTRRRSWQWRVEGAMFTAQPNAGHRALVDLERSGRLHTLVTQNIDGLHVLAGNDPDNVVEVHGTVHQWHCVDCGARGPMTEALDRVRAGEADPPCPFCDGIMKSGTVMFGENLVAADLVRSQLAAANSDVLLAVGTSLTVYPVADMVPIALERGRPVIICNAEPTSFDARAAVVVRGSLSEVLPRIVG